MLISIIFFSSFGARSLSLSKLVPLLCRLVEDQNGQVSDRSNTVFFLLEAPYLIEASINARLFLIFPSRSTLLKHIGWSAWQNHNISAPVSILAPDATYKKNTVSQESMGPLSSRCHCWMCPRDQFNIMAADDLATAVVMSSTTMILTE